MNSAGIAAWGGDWQISFGDSSGTEQRCQGDEKIVGFHGWYGDGIDQSKIYCRKTCKCAPGEFNNNGVCSACQAGTFNTVAGAYSCTPCSAGSYSGNGFTSCTPCSPGSYSEGSAWTCHQCWPGSFSGSSASACSLCIPGKTSGYSASECTSCDAGKYSDSQGSGTCRTCSTCTSGFYQSKDCTTSADRTCQQCALTPPGSYRNGGCTGNQDSTFESCAGCAAGYYRVGCSGTSAGSCDPCPANNYCPGSIYALPKPWTVTSCNAGSFLSIIPSASTNGYCSPCTSSGDYCAGGTAAKTDCPAGFFCASTSTKEVCPAGAFCPVKTANPSQCSAGTYSAVTSAISSATCQPCSAGSYSGSAQSTSCSQCPIGKSGANSGLSFCTDCEAAISKVYQDQLGQTACKPCTQANCPAGTNTQSCQNTLDRQCISCPLISNCLFSDGISGCTNADGSPICQCIPGFQVTLVNSVYSCTQCPQGKYKSLLNGNTCTDWTTSTALGCSSSQYAAAGTRTSNSGCVDFSLLPPVNAFMNGQGWSCNVGYEKS